MDLNNLDILSHDISRNERKHFCSEKCSPIILELKTHRKSFVEKYYAISSVQSENPYVEVKERKCKKYKDLDDNYTFNNEETENQNVCLKKIKHTRDKNIVDNSAANNMQSKNPCVEQGEKKARTDKDSENYAIIHSKQLENHCVEHREIELKKWEHKKNKNLVENHTLNIEEPEKPGVEHKKIRCTNDKGVENDADEKWQSENSFVEPERKKARTNKDLERYVLNKLENHCVEYKKNECIRDIDETYTVTNKQSENLCVEQEKEKYKNDKNFVQNYGVNNKQSQNPSVKNVNDENRISKKCNHEAHSASCNLQVNNSFENDHLSDSFDSINPVASVDFEIDLNDKSRVGRKDHIEAHIVSNDLNVHNFAENNRSLGTFYSSDFIDDPVGFEVPPLHKYEKVCALSDDQQKELFSQGVTIKLGKFSLAEDEIILNNVKDFASEYKISDPYNLLGIGKSRPDPTVAKFLNAKHFYVKLGKGLSNRSLHSIYKRARLLLHPSRNSGKIGNKIASTVTQLETCTGNRQWNEIGGRLGRSGENCLQTYRWHKDSVSKGKWTAEEEQNLIKAIQEVTGESDVSSDKIDIIISWEQVAAHVPTRNYSQCRWYWANHLAWTSDSLKNKWTRASYVKLIGILNKDNVSDVSLIDWEKIHKQFEDVAPSYINLQKRWLYLKSRIPDHKSMLYKDIIRELCKKYKVV